MIDYSIASTFNADVGYHNKPIKFGQQSNKQFQFFPNEVPNRLIHELSNISARLMLDERSED